MFKFTSKIGLIGLALVFAVGCKPKTPDFPIIPAITFRQFIKSADGSIAVAKFDFKDGDHDIGNGDNDIHDIFMTLYQKNGTSWDSITTSGYSVPQMDKDGHRAYEGEIDVELFEPYALPPATKYLVWLKDRVGHISNSVWTDEVTP